MKTKQLPMREERYCAQCGNGFLTAVQGAICVECLNRNYFNKKVEEEL